MDQTIHSFLENSAKLRPNKVAVTSGNNKKTYSELNQESNKIRNFILDSCEKGDRIALLMGNSIEFITIYFGILKSGCVAVILPNNISDDNFKFCVEDCNPKILFYEQRFKNKIERSDIRIKNINTSNENFYSNNIKQVNVTEEDVSGILYTSGTTSNPKGAKLKHKNVVNATKNMQEFIRNDSEDVYLSGLPISHSFGLGHVHVSFMMGGSVILENNFINLKQVLINLREKKATMFAASPSTLKNIVENYLSLFKNCKLKMIITNTGPISKETVTKILDNLKNTNFHYYYGLTEASRSTFINFRENPEGIGSVGKASPNSLVEIRDGEICISGKHVIEDYWNNEEASNQIKNGWLYTGDTGFFNEHGNLIINGRKDDLININGEKVIPEEIENLVKNIKGVKDACATGIEDEMFGERVGLFIVSETTNEKEIINYLKNKVEPYKMPKTISFIESIPKTDSGKVKRGELK